MSKKLQMSPEDVHQAVIDSVTRARSYTDDVEWSCEDGTRTDHDFLCQCVESAIEAGANTINIPDTVGYTIPEEFAALIKMVIERVPNSDKAVFSVHCHNDLGLAVANSLAAVQAVANFHDLIATEARPIPNGMRACSLGKVVFLGFIYGVIMMVQLIAELDHPA